MLKRVLRFCMACLFAILGGGIGYTLLQRFQLFHETTAWFYATCVVTGILFAILAFILFPPVCACVVRWFRKSEQTLAEAPMADLLFGTLGLIIGFVLSYLLTGILGNMPGTVLPLLFSIAAYIFLGLLCARVAARRWAEIPLFKKAIPRGAGTVRQGEKAMPKVLDTSVLIDGRIFDICRTGFLEGPLIIPAFVLQELRHIADASDSAKRNRGRRGLDIIKKMQEELDISVLIEEREYDDVVEVDVKLLKLAVELEGRVVTNDYNLNKVASVSGVFVLNINELAGALTPVILPGEEMSVLIAREGKEMAQGVGYLEDGTMVVVDNAKKYVGQTIDVVVTTVLQTPAGRMFFARIK